MWHQYFQSIWKQIQVKQYLELMQLGDHWKTTGWGHSRNTYLVYLGFWWNKYASCIASLDAAGIPLPHNWDFSLNQRHQSLRGFPTSCSWCSGSWCVQSLSLPWHSSCTNKGWLQGFPWFCDGNYLILTPCWSISVHLWLLWIHS